MTLKAPIGKKGDEGCVCATIVPSLSHFGQSGAKRGLSPWHVLKVREGRDFDGVNRVPGSSD